MILKELQEIDQVKQVLSEAMPCERSLCCTTRMLNRELCNDDHILVVISIYPSSKVCVRDNRNLPDQPKVMLTLAGSCQYVYGLFHLPNLRISRNLHVPRKTPR